MNDLETIVEQARREDRCMAFVYDGKARVVMPHRIKGNRLWCECLHRRNVRSFLIARIEVPQLGERLNTVGPFENQEPPSLQ